MDLPSGVTIENRRGGSDVLSMMASDFATLKTSGYIKTQRIHPREFKGLGTSFSVKGACTVYS